MGDGVPAASEALGARGNSPLQLWQLKSLFQQQLQGLQILHTETKMFTTSYFCYPMQHLVPTRDLGNLSVIITPQRAHVSCSLNNVDMPKSRTMRTISKQYRFPWLKARNQHNAKVLVKSLTMNSDSSANSGASVSPIQSFLLLKIC